MISRCSRQRTSPIQKRGKQVVYRDNRSNLFFKVIVNDGISHPFIAGARSHRVSTKQLHSLNIQDQPPLKTGPKTRKLGLNVRFLAFSVRIERRVARLVQDNRRATSEMITEGTVRRTVHRRGYGRPGRTPLLSAINKRQLIQIAREYKDWPKITWPEESHFQLHRSK